MVELLKKLNNGDMIIYLNPTEMEMLFDYFEHKNFDIEQLGQALRNCHIGLIDELQRVAANNYGLEKLASKIFMARKVLEVRKRNQVQQLQVKTTELFNKMREYVKNNNEFNFTLGINYRMINGDEKLNYTGLNLGDDFCLEIVSFNVEPNTGMIIDYKKTILNGKKQKENWDENLRMPGISCSKQQKQSHHYSKANEKDREKAKNAIDKELNQLIVQTFGVERTPEDPMFNDPKFKELYEENIRLKQESIRRAHEMDYLRRNNNPQIMQVQEKEGKQL